MDVSNIFMFLFMIVLTAASSRRAKEIIDKAIEENLTNKLTDDLIQSLEMKFQNDLESSVDVVLSKIRNLLQNGTNEINEKLSQIQSNLEVMQNVEPVQVTNCLKNRTNETSLLVEKALHQMVLCGYALIGHDPAQALAKVMEIKQSIKNGLKPVTFKYPDGIVNMYNYLVEALKLSPYLLLLEMKKVNEQRKEVFDLLKVCGHDHDSMKKVVKCVISKSPVIKTAMMHITSQTVNGIVQLTKLMAHGAMHEACLIEVIKSVEDETELILSGVKVCAFGKQEVRLLGDKSQVVDLTKNNIYLTKPSAKLNGNDEISQMKTLLNKMLNGGDELDHKFRRKLQRLQNSIKSDEENML